MTSNRLIDRTGLTYGRLTVVERVENHRSGQAQWYCVCSCGSSVEVMAYSLSSGSTKSCGCLRRELAAAKGRAHKGAPRKGVVGYTGAHQRVRAARGAASEHACACGAVAEEWAYDHADPDEVTEVATRARMTGKTLAYSLDPNHYAAMCHGCHVRFDIKHTNLK